MIISFHLIWPVIGLLLMFVGAELLVRGSSRMARRLGVSPLVIGLTVVAISTSAPEILTSVAAALRGMAGVAVGNVIGSNIYNLTLVLGIAALIRPIRVKMRLLKLDVPLMILATVVFYVLALNGTLGRLDGIILIVGLVAYFVFVLKGAREEPEVIEEKYDEFIETRGTLLGHVTLTIVGFLVLWTGVHFILTGATEAARFLGISEFALGFVIIAFAAVLPELMIAIAASIKGESEIVVATVVGSNALKILAGLGIAALARPIQVPGSVLRIEAPLMLVFGFVLFGFVWTDRRLSRWEGAVLVLMCVLIVALLALPSR